MTTFDYESAFAQILEKCLCMRPQDELVVLLDESMTDFYPSLTNAAVRKSVQATYIAIPEIQQQDLVSRIQLYPDVVALPAPIRMGIQHANGIINLLSGNQQTVPVRRAILQAGRPHGCRFAHVPGISSDVLKTVAISDFDKILDRCEMLAWFLGNAKRARLVTRDRDGTEYELSLQLGGWENEPLMSPGIIFPNSWGNLPPGETFCCPAPQFVNGQVCVNGSVPGHVLRDAEEIVLTFKNGKMKSWQSDTSKIATEFFDHQMSEAIKNGDPNWNTFAELGVGANDAISDLTGNSLFDEKVYGTMHVAIGDNSSFGHGTKSDIHADLVVRRPTFILDDFPVITNGHLAEQARKYRGEWSPSQSKTIPTARFRLKEDEISTTGDLTLRRLCSAGRIGGVNMVNSSASDALTRLCEEIRQLEQPTFDELESVPHADRLVLLDTLAHYRCLEFAT